jgi:hypothetical protein
MAKFSVNQDAAWKSIPKGEYNVMVGKAVLKEPKPDPKDPAKEKFPYVEVEMIVLDGEFKDEVFTDRLSLSPKAEARLASFIRACGLAAPGDKGAREFDTEDLIGKPLTVKGDVETFAGQERFRPSSFKVHPDVARLQQDEMNRQAEEARQQQGAAPAVPAPAAAPAKGYAAPARPAVKRPI